MSAVLCGQGTVFKGVRRCSKAYGDYLKLRDSIEKRKSGLLTGNNEYETDDTGMSGSSVLLYVDKALKMQVCSEEAGLNVLKQTN